MSKINILKYTNRKLYSKTNSRYVTLSNIYEMVKAGKDVEVLDNRTQADITADTLVKAFSTHSNLSVEEVCDLIRHRQ